MYEPVNFNRFVKAFAESGRSSSFSYEGLQALFKYLESLEDETDVEIELDVIALDRQYAEYASLAAANKDLGHSALAVARFPGGVIVDLNL